MREYRIVRTDLGWNISRKKQMGRLMLLQYLNGKGLWTPNKGLARIFYHREDAVSALVVMKKKMNKNLIRFIILILILIISFLFKMKVG